MIDDECHVRESIRGSGEAPDPGARPKPLAARPAARERAPGAATVRHCGQGQGGSEDSVAGHRPRLLRAFRAWTVPHSHNAGRATPRLAEALSAVSGNAPYSRAMGSWPCLRHVEGLAEQRLDCPALNGTEHAQLAMDGQGGLAGSALLGHERDRVHGVRNTAESIPDSSYWLWNWIVPRLHDPGSIDRLTAAYRSSRVARSGSPVSTAAMTCSVARPADTVASAEFQRLAPQKLDASHERGEGAGLPVSRPTPAVGEADDGGLRVDFRHRSRVALADVEPLVGAEEEDRVARRVDRGGRAALPAKRARRPRLPGRVPDGSPR